jgi:hypothetical protein
MVLAHKSKMFIGTQFYTMDLLIDPVFTFLPIKEYLISSELG